MKIPKGLKGLVGLGKAEMTLLDNFRYELVTLREALGYSWGENTHTQFIKTQNHSFGNSTLILSQNP